MPPSSLASTRDTTTSVRVEPTPMVDVDWPRWGGASRENQPPGDPPRAPARPAAVNAKHFPPRGNAALPFGRPTTRPSGDAKPAAAHPNTVGTPGPRARRVANARATTATPRSRDPSESAALARLYGNHGDVSLAPRGRAAATKPASARRGSLAKGVPARTSIPTAGGFRAKTAPGTTRRWASHGPIDSGSRAPRKTPPPLLIKTVGGAEPRPEPEDGSPPPGYRSAHGPARARVASAGSGRAPARPRAATGSPPDPHPHENLFRALRDHTALRAEWRAELDAAVALVETERRRANEAHESMREMEVEMGWRRQSVELAEAARKEAEDARAAAEEQRRARIHAEEEIERLREAIGAATTRGEEKAARARAAEAKTTLAHEARRKAEEARERERERADAAFAARDVASADLTRERAAAAAAAEEVSLARRTLADADAVRAAHARTLALVKGERDAYKEKLAAAEEAAAEARRESAYLESRFETNLAKARADAEKTLAARLAEAAVEANARLEAASAAAEATFAAALAEAEAKTRKWRRDAETHAAAVTILRGQHEAYVAGRETAGTERPEPPTPRAPLLRVESREIGDEDGDGEAQGDGDGKCPSAAAAPPRAREGATPIPSPGVRGAPRREGMGIEEAFEEGNEDDNQDDGEQTARRLEP